MWLHIYTLRDCENVYGLQFSYTDPVLHGCLAFEAVVQCQGEGHTLSNCSLNLSSNSYCTDAGIAFYPLISHLKMIIVK